MIEYTEEDWKDIRTGYFDKESVPKDLTPNQKIEKFLDHNYGTCLPETIKILHDILFNIPYEELPLHINDTTIDDVCFPPTVNVGGGAIWRLKRGK